MAIDWGAWEGSGYNRIRVGIDVSWESVGHNEAGATATVKIYTDVEGSWSDSQTLTFGGAIGGSVSFNNTSNNSQALRATKSYTYNYGSNEYGSSPGSKTFTASLSGAYNGATPSKSVSSKIPARPYGAPAAPTNVAVARINDSSQKITWTNRSTAGEPWSSVTVQRDDGANGVWNSTVATTSGGATSATDSGTSTNSKVKYRARSNNSEGSSGWVETAVIYATPSPPSSATRTAGSGSTQTVSWTNKGGYTEYQTEVQRGVTDPATLATTWTTVVDNLASGVTSYADTGASNSQRTKYRVRHKTSAGPQGTLYSAYSNETTETAGVTRPPLAPTKLQPSGLTIDPTLTQRLAWTFSPALAGDAQTAFTLQHRVAGTSTWTTVSQTTANQYYDLPANTYQVDATIEWQVSTKGGDPVYGPYSVPVTFKTAIVPVPADPVKAPVQMDLATGQLEANTNAYEQRDYVMRIQSNIFGGGVRTVDSSYNVTWSQRFIAINLGNSDNTFPSGHHDIVNPFGWTVTTKQIVVTGGISRATLTFSTSTVQARTGETIVVSGVGAPYDGAWTVRSISSNQVNFDLPTGTAAQSSTAATGSVFVQIQGHGGAANAYPVAGKVALPTWTALYYELPFGWGGGSTVKKNGLVNATSKAVTSNVATIGIAGGHWFSVGDRVVVSIGDATFDGAGAERTVTAVTPTSVSFALTTANVATTNITDPYAIVKPTGKDTFFGNFHLVGYQQDFVVPSNWVMLAMRNNDLATVEWGTGDTVDPGYDSDSPVFKQAIFNSTQDVNASAGNKPAIRIGSITAAHVRMDNNELQAMNSDTAVATFLINNSGGHVTLSANGYNTQMNGAVVAPNLTTVASGAANINYNSANGVFRYVTSSRRHKTGIRDLEVDPATVLRLRPRVFRSTLEDDDPDEDIVGFIAEEAEDLGLGHWVDRRERDGETEVMSFFYPAWTVALQAVCRDQQGRIEELESRLAAIESRLDNRA